MRTFLNEIKDRVDLSDDWSIKISSLIIDDEKTGYDAMTVLDFMIEHVDEDNDDKLIIECSETDDTESYSLKWFIELLDSHKNKKVIFNIIDNNNLIEFKFDSYDIGHSDKTILITLK